MANEKTTGGASRHILQGANLAVYTLVALAIAVLVNYYASRYTRHWDLTPNKNYSLSSQTQKVVKNLNRDVTIYVFDRERAFRDRRDLLDQYTAASRRITVSYVDPDRDPALAEHHHRAEGRIRRNPRKQLVRAAAAYHPLHRESLEAGPRTQRAAAREHRLCRLLEFPWARNVERHPAHIGFVTDVG